MEANARGGGGYLSSYSRVQSVLYTLAFLSVAAHDPPLAAGLTDHT
jgi:hypothetical protein